MAFELRVAGTGDVVVFSDELDALQRANTINVLSVQGEIYAPGCFDPIGIATVHEVDDNDAYCGEYSV